MTTNVLIVDDDAFFKKIVDLKLRSFIEGFNSIAFENITNARNFLQSPHEKITLAVLDEHLPDGRGTELLAEGWFSEIPVLMMSSDTAPEIPGASIKAGAMFFINKEQVRHDLFQPLVEGIIERSKLLEELQKSKANAIKMETVKTLVSTLRHEINNPLGAVLGATFIMRSNENISPDQMEAIDLVEKSGQRIKLVLDKLCDAMELESTDKANQTVYQIPGDKPWE